MWLGRLKTNYKRSATKAAETRRQKNATLTTEPKDEFYSGVCQALYGDSDKVDNWADCEKSDT